MLDFFPGLLSSVVKETGILLVREMIVVDGWDPG
jgi:hypothetical protein